MVVVIAAAAGYFSTTERARGIDLHSRLLSSEAVPAEMMESCTWDTAAPERTAFQGPRSGGAAGAGPAMGDPQVAARTPAQTIRDPYD
jgi:hypothetical protein